MPTTMRDDYAPSLSPWGAQTGARYRVLCSDGRVRIATATSEADTFFTIPARVSVRGRTVSGSVYARSDAFDERPPRYRFAAYTYRRNADALPAWSDGITYGAGEDA